MKHLVFVTSTFHLPSGHNNYERENMYYYCYQHLLKLVPKDQYDIVFCDNSVSGIESLVNEKLRNFLVKQRTFFLDRNIGSVNIGMGELDELIYICDKMDLSAYKNVIYLTGRRFVANPWIFEKVAEMKKDALLCNPPFLHIRNNYNFDVSSPTEKLYNDMFFAMSSELMIRYAAYSKEKIPSNLQNSVGSEQNLYNFIHENNVEYEWLEHLGLIRIDYKADNELQLI